MKFNEMLARARNKDYKAPNRLLCLDPGEVTGWAIFVDGELDSWGQVETYIKADKYVDWEALQKLFEKAMPTAVVCENYRVYQHKLKTHANSEIVTVRIIGGIDMICSIKRLPLAYQMASMAKGFCTDQKLRSWGYWKEGMRHSRDAIRHGCYYLLFNKEVSTCRK